MGLCNRKTVNIFVVVVRLGYLLIYSASLMYCRELASVSKVLKATHVKDVSLVLHYLTEEYLGNLFFSVLNF